MKTTKFVKGFSILCFSALVFAGCASDSKDDSASSESATAQSSTEATKESETTESTTTVVAGGELQDGTFKLEEQNYKNDYRAVFEIVVKDGKIAESKYDNVNEAGDSKKDDAEYNKNMKAKSGTNPEAFIPALNDQLVEKQSAGAIEVVTGATHSSESFQNYAQQLIQAAQAGNTETIKINNGGDLQDGTYTLEEKNYSNGYRVQFTMTVADGKVSESNFDYVNEAGKSKKDDAEYNEAMKAKSGTNAEEFIPKFNEELVAAMNGEEASPTAMDVVTGATHSFHSFLLYSLQLVNAAENGNTTPITVDNIVTK